MKEDKLASARDGAYIAGALPYIEADIDRLLKSIDHRAMSANPMTQELSLVLWTERLCYLRLIGKLRQKVEIGVSQGQQFQDELNL